MPANYDRKRRIGSILRTGGANRLFLQVGNRFLLAGAAVIIRSSTAAVGATLVQTVAPFGIRVQPMLVSTLLTNASSVATNFISDGTGSPTLFNFQQSQSAGLDTTTILGGIYTDTSANITWSTTIGAGTISTNALASIGWIDTRGING
ncbi:hypothetical protein IB244_31210 [Rhizobium sp. RHZ02]|nr:hypothetical protein [Rhizobium sp. RHZ02]